MPRIEIVSMPTFENGEKNDRLTIHLLFFPLSYFLTKKGLQFKKKFAILRSINPNGMSPSGKATVFDTVIRWFESSHPNQ